MNIIYMWSVYTDVGQKPASDNAKRGVWCKHQFKDDCESSAPRIRLSSSILCEVYIQM